MPAVARKQVFTWKLLNTFAASSPVSDRVGALKSPPETIRFMRGFDPRIYAMLRALVMTVRELKFTSNFANSVAVEPESRIIELFLSLPPYWSG